MNRRAVYLDCQATTPVAPEVLEAMMPYFTEHFGNPASRTHEYGWRAEAAVSVARKSVAQLIGAHEKEVIFTSSATESNHLAVLGVAEEYAHKGRHIIASVVEHSSLNGALEILKNRGWEITLISVNQNGLVDLDALKAAIRPDTVLVSVIFAQNEIGTLQPIAKIGRICREKGVIFHTDAVQALLTEKIDVDEMDISLLSISAHKIYGSKGVGALYVRHKTPRVRLAPQLRGGGHEYGLRSGTLNVPGIVGLGRACQLVMERQEQDRARLTQLRDHLWSGLSSRIERIKMNGHPSQRLPQNLSVTIDGVLADTLLIQLKNVALSAGSACSSAREAPSSVLTAIGLSELGAKSTIRFGLGRTTTQEDIDFTIDQVARAVQDIRVFFPDNQGLLETLA